MDTPADVFRGITDRFAGVTVDGREENVDKSSFRDRDEFIEQLSVECIISPNPSRGNSHLRQC